MKPRRRRLGHGCAGRAARGSRRRPSEAALAACGRRRWIWSRRRRRIAAGGVAGRVPPRDRARPLALARRGHSGARWRHAWLPPGAACGGDGAISALGDGRAPSRPGRVRLRKGNPRSGQVRSGQVELGLLVVVLLLLLLS